MSDGNKDKSGGWGFSAGLGNVLGNIKSGVTSVVDKTSTFLQKDSEDGTQYRNGSNKKAENPKVNQCSPIQYCKGKPIAGTTMNTRKRSKAMTPKEVCLDANGDEETHVWGDGDASLFNLRVGPNYKKTGAKAPSAPALYDIVGIDLYASANRIVNIGSQVHLPDEWTSVTTNHPKVPAVFIVVAQLPDVTDALSGLTNFFVDKSEGPGTSVVMYYRIKAETAEALKNFATCSPALKLFVEFCSSAPGANYKDPKHPMAGRFKVCPLVDNIDELGLPGFITSYNAKPALVVQCGDVFRGEGYVCVDSNVHGFGGIARSGMQLISFDSMQMKWGFAIESREEEDMPEVLFGTCFIDKPLMEPMLLPNWDLAIAKKE